MHLLNIVIILPIEQHQNYLRGHADTYFQKTYMNWSFNITTLISVMVNHRTKWVICNIPMTPYPVIENTYCNKTWTYFNSYVTKQVSFMVILNFRLYLCVHQLFICKKFMDIINYFFHIGVWCHFEQFEWELKQTNSK